MIWRRIFQVLAVVSSLTLAGGFVYVKAGGVIPGLPSSQPAPPPVLPSSKVMALEPLILTNAENGEGVILPPSEPNLLPGWKSAKVRLFDGTQPHARPPEPPLPAAAPPVDDKTIIFGPKSAPVITPVVPPLAKPFPGKSPQHAYPRPPTESGAPGQTDAPGWHPFQY